MAFRNDNKFIPKYVANDLKWYEKDRLDTWYFQNKCADLLMDTDEHFKKMKVVNFDIIKNEVSQEKFKQYHLIDHQEIMHYPLHICEEIFSLIFQNSNRKDMHTTKSTVNEHFKNTNKTVCTGRGRFIKKIRDDMYAESW